MKTLLVSLISIIFVAGCSGQKNRLADEKNKEYQKKLAQKKAHQQGQRELIIPEDRSAQNQGLGNSPGHSQNSGSSAQNGSANSGGSTGHTNLPAETAPAPVPDPTLQPAPAPAPAPAPSQAPANSNSASDAEKAQAEAEAKRQAELDRQEAAKKEAQMKAEAEAQQKAQAEKARKEAEEKSRNEAAAQAAAAEAAAKNKPADAAQTDKASATSASGQYGPEYLTYVEFAGSQQALQTFFKENYQAIRTQIASEGAVIETKTEEKKIDFKLLQAGRILAEAKDLTLDPGQVFKGEANGYSYIGGCIEKKCGILFLAIYKLGTDGQTLEFNYSRILKKVEAQFVESKVKSEDDYKKEFEALKAEFEAKEAAAGKSAAAADSGSAASGPGLRP